MNKVVDIPEFLTGSLHLGRSLERNVEAYGNLMSSSGELCQNSVDLQTGGATHISIEINLDLGAVKYYDNGRGLNIDTLGEALNSICFTRKKNDGYGKFGLGMVAYISICEKFYMTTAPQGKGYIEVEFNRAKLFSTAHGGFNFPVKKKEDLIHEDKKTPGAKSWSPTVWWRTSVEVVGLTNDKVKRSFNLEEFRSNIQTQYGAKMAQLGTTIKVSLTENGKTKEMTFQAKLFAGKQLPVWETVVDGAGKVSVNFFLVPHGYKGKLNMGFGNSSNPSRVPINNLFLSPFMQAVDQTTRDALKSGMFQGEVICDGLVMNVNRKSFEHDDAQIGLVVALDKWYQEVGRQYYENEKQKRTASRYQAIGLEVIERLSDMFDVKSSPFADLLSGALYGSTGKGHAKPKKGSIVDGPGFNGKASSGSKENGSSEKKGGEGGHGSNSKDRDDSRKEKPKHHPNVSIGDDGSPRRVVKGHSTGFHILVEDIGSKLWHFETEALCLRINDTHPLFEEVEKSDARLRDLYANVIITAFRIASVPVEFQTGAQRFAEEHMEDWVHKILIKQR